MYDFRLHCLGAVRLFVALMGFLGVVGSFGLVSTESRASGIADVAIAVAIDEPLSATPTPTATPFDTPAPTATPAATDSAPPTETPTPTLSPTPTLTPSPTNTPRPSPTPTPAWFDFVGQPTGEGDTQGWVFRAPAAGGPFSSAASLAKGAAPGFLSLQAANNVNSFGFWESPILAFNPSDPRLPAISAQTGLPVVPFSGPTGAGALYTAQWKIRSNVSDPAKVPQLRLRATQADLQQSNFLTVDSRDDGAFSPTPEGRTYTLVFSPSVGAPGMMLEFELLNFSPLDAPDGNLDLDWVRITRRNPDDLADRQVVKKYDFKGSPQGWTQNTIPGFTAPQSGLVIWWGKTVQWSLYLRSPGVAGTFGYWLSPLGDVIIDSSKLYIATFRVGSNIPAGERTTVPQFRVRLNESTFHTATYLAVESQGDATACPVVGGAQYYTVYMQPPPSAHGASLTAAFDLLAFDPKDAPRGELYLFDATIEAVKTPW